MCYAFLPKTKVFYVRPATHGRLWTTRDGEQAGHTAACYSKHTVRQMDGTFLGVNPADDLV